MIKCDLDISSTAYHYYVIGLTNIYKFTQDRQAV